MAELSKNNDSKGPAGCRSLFWRKGKTKSERFENFEKKLKFLGRYAYLCLTEYMTTLIILL